MPKEINHDFTYAYDSGGLWHALRFQRIEYREGESTDRGYNATTLCGVVPVVGGTARVKQRVTCWECLLADSVPIEEEALYCA